MIHVLVVQGRNIRSAVEGIYSNKKDSMILQIIESFFTKQSKFTQ